MSYAKSYLGDTLATGAVIKTLEAKTAILPGITVRADLVRVMGNVAEFWYNIKPTVQVTTPGADFNSTNVGVKKATLTLGRALQIDEKIPQVAIETISAPIVADFTVKGSIGLANKMGELFITELLALAQAKTYTNGLKLVAAIAEAIGVFELGASVKILGVADTTFSNKENGIRPTAVLVGPAGKAKLLADPAFQALFQGAGQGSYPALLGTLFGLNVVFAQDLTGVDFVLINHEGIGYPYSLNALRVVEAEGFVGVRLQGEIAMVNATQPGVLVIDSYAMKFTEASGA
jgi:hypothetical protein